MKASLAKFPGLAIWACLAFTSMVAEAADFKHPKLKDNETQGLPGRYIVQFDRETAGSANALVQSVRDTLSQDIEITNKVDHQFFSSITIDVGHADPDIVRHILELPDVKAVYPVKEFYPSSIWSESSSMQKRGTGMPTSEPQKLAQVDKVRSELGYTGKGVFVGVIDGGVDYMHPALGGGFGKGYKVVAGYDLVGDFPGPDGKPVPKADPSVKCAGAAGSNKDHGTHVSGIIAGNSKKDGFYGVAPDATLGHWRVFGCKGIAETDNIVKAILMAYDAGVDIISMSISQDAGFSVDSPISDVVKKVIASGVHFVSSAGNTGINGLFDVGRPAANTQDLSVAAMTLSYPRLGYITNSLNTNKAFILGTEAVSPKDGQLAVGDLGASEDAPGCELSDISDSVKGKLAIVPFGGCDASEKSELAAKKGAIGLIIYGYNKSGTHNENTKIPTVFVTYSDGEDLVNSIKAGKQVDIKFHMGTEPTVAPFSAYGPNSAIELVPRISAIGGDVNSTLPSGRYGVMSGTSMSTPLVAGTIALYLNAHGKKKQSVEYINEALQNYARPYNVEASATIDNPVRQGAGMIQLYDSITQGIHVSPSQISFNDTASNAYKTRTIKITNKGKDIVQFDVVNDVASSLSITIPKGDKKDNEDEDEDDEDPLSIPKNVQAPAKLKFSKKVLKISPGTSQSIKITVTPPAKNGKDHVFYGGYVHLKSRQKTKNVDVRIPYIGINDDMRKLPGFKYY